MFAIRPYHPSDLPQLYRICLRTGDSGANASLLYDDPDLLGHIYAAPYAVLEPDLCFVLTQGGAPCGYILGTADSLGFQRKTETQWFPVLRERYALPLPENSRDAAMIRLIHEGYRYPDNLTGYPAHLHIDLLPEAQGQGWGGKLMRTFLEALRAEGISGVHLGVSKRNARAISFYERVGFTRLFDAGSWLAYGKTL